MKRNGEDFNLYDTSDPGETGGEWVYETSRWEDGEDEDALYEDGTGCAAPGYGDGYDGELYILENAPRGYVPDEPPYADPVEPYVRGRHEAYSKYAPAGPEYDGYAEDGEEFAEDGEAEGEYEEEDELGRELYGQYERARSKRQKRHRARRIFWILVLVLLLPLLLGRQPGKTGLVPFTGPRKCNILLAGTDAEGIRTDTLLLLSLDRPGRGIRLLSIPRDTYVSDYYVSPKINSAMGVGGGGESGMQELLRQTEKILGFAPDGYVLLHLDAFVEAVDALGGVDFDVPVDMYYEDWDQNLCIDLRAGPQHLNGEQAMGLVRFRSGYANADIGRTEVQRDFIKAALKQWLRPRTLLAVPKLMKIYRQEVLTDLSLRNILWLGRDTLLSNLRGMTTEVLPGYSAMVGDASCYVLDGPAAADMLTKYTGE